MYDVEGWVPSEKRESPCTGKHKPAGAFSLQDLV